MSAVHQSYSDKTSLSASKTSDKKNLCLLCLIIFLLFGLTDLLPAYDHSQPIIQAGIYLEGPFDFQKLLSFNPDIVWREADYIEILTDVAELSEIEAVGLSTEIIHDDVVEFCQSRLQAKAMGAYRDLEEINTKIDSIIAANPSIVSPKISIGQSIEGRDIWAFKISDNPTLDESEPEVLYNACIHAREVITPELLFYFIDYILQHYGSNSTINYIVDNRELWFIPMVNPDGYYWNQVIEPFGGGMWRKNRRYNGDGTYGVDLNRNFGYMWGYDDVGSAPDTWDETYRGTGPFSEPETQALRDFAAGHEFILAIHYHSYSNLILWPWGYINTPCSDDDIFAAIGQTASQWNWYEPIPGWLLYPTNGDANDWFYGEQSSKNKVFSYVIEVGTYWDYFWPPPYRIPELIDENLLPNIYYAQVADNPFYSDNAGPGFGACYTDDPFILGPGGDTTFTITMQNDGRYSYDNSFSITVSYYHGMGWVDVNPKSGVIPYGENNTTDLTVTVTAPDGAADPSLWKATIDITHSGVSSPREVPICLEVASDIKRPQYADLATACKRMRIFNNGEMAKYASHAALDYIDECDTFNVMTDPTMYLYDASPVICRLGDGGDTLRYTMYAKMISAPDGLQAVSYMTVDSTSFTAFDYAQVEYKTADNAIELRSKYYVPKDGDYCDFVTVTQEFKNLTGDTLHDVLIGLFLDWNIPSDSGSMNGSGYHVDTTVSTIHQPDDDTAYFATIYQYGAEFYDSLMGDCGQYSDQRFGGIVCDPHTIFRNAQILRISEYVDTAGPYGQAAPLPPGPIYRMMKENAEFSYYEPYDEYDYPNLATLVTFGEYDLPPNLTYSYTYILLTTKDGLNDYLARGEAASEWVAAQPEIKRHCLDLAGDANNDGTVNIGDAVFLINFVFRPASPAPECPAEGDANGDGSVNIGDAVYLNAFIFFPGSPAPVPGPEK